MDEQRRSVHQENTLIIFIVCPLSPDILCLQETYGDIEEASCFSSDCFRTMNLSFICFSSVHPSEHYLLQCGPQIVSSIESPGLGNNPWVHEWFICTWAKWWLQPSPWGQAPQKWRSGHLLIRACSEALSNRILNQPQGLSCWHPCTTRYPQGGRDRTASDWAGAPRQHQLCKKQFF